MKNVMEESKMLDLNGFPSVKVTVIADFWREPMVTYEGTLNLHMYDYSYIWGDVEFARV